ncbi:MAG: class I SAM-dependent methyltransferase [Deltaproteobacteria bacterium]|nr:class I SAM-dependent methyltransferase [Deltaproteobacteria bacterium]
MPENFVHSPACRWCGKGPLRFRFSFEAKLDRKAKPEDFALEECQSCGSFQVNPHPDRELLRNFFTQKDIYLKGVDPDGKAIDPLARAEEREEEYRNYASHLIPLLPEYGTILDVGAGTGLMLSLLPKKYRRLALEPNPLAAQKARERDKGLIVIEDFIEDLNPSSEPLILVICNQSLDHLLHPNLTLGKLLNWLSPGGLILLTGLINPQSLAARVTGPNFRLWHPFHQVYPPRKAVEDKLSSYGLDTLGIWRPYFNTPYGSAAALFEGAFILAHAWLAQGSKKIVSPPWPGNTISYLAKKNRLFKPLKVMDGNAVTA